MTRPYVVHDEDGAPVDAVREDFTIEVECPAEEIQQDIFQGSTHPAIEELRHIARGEPTTNHPSHDFDEEFDHDTIRCQNCGVLYGGLQSGRPCDAVDGVA